ncbi:MAG: BLUF domain-containing protein [Candidatus Phaeomarinobacter sp.]
MAFCQLAYVSDASGSNGCYHPDDLNHLVACARRNNVRDGITSFLLAGNTGFVQLIEGPRVAVLSLFDRLESDPRHHNLVLLHRDDADVRAFPNNPMCLMQAEADALSRLETAVPVLGQGLCAKLTAEATGLI